MGDYVSTWPLTCTNAWSAQVSTPDYMTTPPGPAGPPETVLSNLCATFAPRWRTWLSHGSSRSYLGWTLPIVPEIPQERSARVSALFPLFLLFLLFPLFHPFRSFSLCNMDDASSFRMRTHRDASRDSMSGIIKQMDMFGKKEREKRIDSF